MRTIISHASAKGNRGYQEDRYQIITDDAGILIGVFDGHGGDTASEFCKENLKAAFDAVADNPALPFIKDKLWGLFDYLNVRTVTNDDGTTASIIFIPPPFDQAYVGILGDSPVIIKKQEGEYWRSPEHNVRSNPPEVGRIKKLGGTVFGGYAYAPRAGFTASGLQLSRTLGDSSFGAILSREPEIFEIPLEKNSVVLVGTDGLLDPEHGSDSAYKEIAKLIEGGATAGNLVNHALNKPTGDNVTAVLVRIVE